MLPPSLAPGLIIPAFFKCPISLDLMVDPVTLCTGVTYDRSSIETWLDDGHNTCPATMRILDNRDLIPNHTLRRLIQQWCVSNASHGIQRIPTPTPPAEPRQVQLILDAIACGDVRLAALRRLRTLATQSDRNRRCIGAAGALRALVEIIGSETLGSNPEFAQITQEAVGSLVLFSLDEDSRRVLIGTQQLTLISRLLQLEGYLDARVNAAQLLEALAVDRVSKLKIGGNDGILGGSIALLREQLCPAAVTAGLKTLLALSQALKNRIKIVEMGAVPTLVELLPGAEKGRVERVMALLDVLSACAEGRAALRRHALAIPSVVKSLLGVSASTSEHAVGVLWSVCFHSADEGSLHETIQLGTFNKLLLLVQMDCDLRTKQKANGLLRLFSQISGNMTCTTATGEEI